MDASDLANHLMDVEYAGAQRCEACATLLDPGPLQALLLLLAAEHREAATALNDAVVRLRGAPQSGEADGVLRAPPRPGVPTKGADEETQLANCITEARGAVDSYRRALAAAALPEWLQRLLAGRLGVAQQQLDRLLQVHNATSEVTRT